MCFSVLTRQRLSSCLSVCFQRVTGPSSPPIQTQARSSLLQCLIAPTICGAVPAPPREQGFGFFISHWSRKRWTWRWKVFNRRLWALHSQQPARLNLIDGHSPAGLREWGCHLADLLVVNTCCLFFCSEGSWCRSWTWIRTEDQHRVTTPQKRLLGGGSPNSGWSQES